MQSPRPVLLAGSALVVICLFILLPPDRFRVGAAPASAMQQRAPGDKSSDKPPPEKAPDTTGQTPAPHSSTPAAADHREHMALVTQAEDVHAMLTAAGYWPRIAAFAKDGQHPIDNLWTIPLLKYYFFAGGALFSNLGHPDLAMEHETVWPAGKGYLGKAADPKHYFVIATDVHLDPILMPNEGLSDRYYPRREGDWLMEFYLPSFLYGADVTGEVFPGTVRNFSRRSVQLADYLLYSQYDINGDNPFCHDNFLENYVTILQQAQQQRWQYGFDDLFDARWQDISGYTWSPHEPDLGVNAGSQALGLLRAWEVYRDQKYMDGARNFLLYQIPRHGFHTGLWKGRRYYWLSATPQLEAAAGEDPVNSVEALVAAPLAAVGYYTHDNAMLELARGLLWYLCREWATNGRWYYEGQENSAIQRDHPLLSQEGVCAAYSALALPYLLASGIDLTDEVEGLSPAIHFLVTHRPDSYPLQNSDTRFVRSYVAFGRTRGLRPGNTLLIRTFVQVTGSGAASMVLSEKLPAVVKRPARLDVTVKRGDQSTSVKVDVARDGAFSVPIGTAPFKPWDVYTVDYNVTLSSKFTVDDFPMERPVVAVAPDPGVPAVNYTGETQDYHYQTRINADNFLDVPRWFYFPHNPDPGK